MTSGSGDPACSDPILRATPASSGSPGPTVVFEAAIGGDHTLWAIGDRIRDRAFVCLYDRPGDGEAPGPARPRTAISDVADLHALLSAADIPKPVVMVGHSYGGLVAWMEAAEHPDEVAGVVLIDPAHPYVLQRLEALMTDEQRQVFQSGLSVPNVAFQASRQEAATELGSTGFRRPRSGRLAPPSEPAASTS